VKLLRSLVVLLALLGMTEGIRAQDAPPATINLFFDCTGGSCGDLDFLRREVPFVNWMRDRADADLHVLVTSQATGGGGRLYTLVFLGLRDFLADDQELTYTSAADATLDEQRNGIVGRLRLGLVHYVQGTPIADRLRVTYVSDSASADTNRAGPASAAPEAQADPWDYWVFNFNLRANANGEATSTFSNTSGGFSASRTTDAWKTEVGINFFRNVQKFEFTSGGVTQSIEEKRQDWRASSFLVRSLTGQWSVGFRASGSSTTVLNQHLRVSFEPGIEYNFFPYAESSRRSLTLQYLVGPTYFEYGERTIFGETQETRFIQSLTGGLSLNQPWGRWSTSMTAAQYLHSPKRYSVTLFGNVNVRLFRGFSVTASANYAWLRDQLYLSAAGATPEQVLLRQRQLETSYRYFYSVGIQYRFGSIFNNVVNPRFGGGGGEVIIF
jgi:hypothetical protein